MNAITTTTAAEPAMLSFLERAVTNPDFDVQKFEVVLSAMQQERAKQAERAFYTAMATAQGEMEPVRRDATNPSTRSKYARFESIDAIVRPVYTRHGFSVSYRTGTPSRPGAVRVICTVAHEAGHSVEAELEAALDGSGAQGRSNKTDVQATGSTVSYLRRYILTMVWNIALASDDDDGEGSRSARPPAQRMAQTSMRDMRPRPLDETLRGDDIPDFDAPPPPAKDKLREAADRIKAKLSEAHDQDSYNAVMGNAGISTYWGRIRDERPELADELEAHRSLQLDRIAADMPAPMADAEDAA